MSRERQRGAPPGVPKNEEVGYGQPPSEHRVKVGERRNPWGRRGKPKPVVDFLDQTLVLRIDGEPRTLTRAEALDHFLFAKAAKGDVRAIQLLEVRSQARRQSAALPGDNTLSPDEQAAFDRFLRRAATRLAGEGGS